MDEYGEKYDESSAASEVSAPAEVEGESTSESNTENYDDCARVEAASENATDIVEDAEDDYSDCAKVEASDGRLDIDERTEDGPKLREGIKDNPKYIDENGDLRWPEGGGFKGEPENVTLEPGTLIDRYGSESGRFTAFEGTPYEKRSLPFEEKSQEYYRYVVVERIDNVRCGETDEAFDQPGGGVQQELPESIESLVERGKLRRIEE